ncbi:hypothetical protein KY328_03630 [Candidatus Woesearchaeota archaeon]|nr:hypothetical protein [Candidatus Woesearchaeota archaeon]MBW3021986.1 hypothetical protein [Candidatus Woesearchaeota archaeon]
MASDIMREIESDVFKDSEFSAEELQDAVDEDDMNAEDAGVLFGAEGGYNESS